MKFKMLLSLVTMLMAGCQIENDMMIPKDLAGYEIFEIDGQVSSTINSSKQLVEVKMPWDANLHSLKISKIKYTDATFGKDKQYARGDVLDLSDTLHVRLNAFRSYDWRLIAVNASKDEPVKGKQLYNMSFDNWALEGKGYFPYAPDASDSDKVIWTTANKGTSDLLGKNTTIPEEDFLAVKGPGKKAAKLTSQFIAIKFASGNIFTGEFCGLKGTKGADLAWGVPFTDRPKSLHGYYCYQPKAINHTDKAHESMKGQTDIGQIQVILADWDKHKWDGYPDKAIDEKGRFHVINSDSQFIDFENDPAIIGWGNMVFSKWMDSYQKFDLPITYRSDRTPSVVVIISASSRYGDYFTGAEGTVLYLDEFEFVY